MAIRRIFFLLARAYFLLLVLLTSLYCLLSFIPFSYHWLIKFSPVAWLPEFAKLHPYLWLLAVVVVWPTLTGAFQDTRTRRLAIAFVIGGSAGGVALLVRPFLVSVPNDYRAFIWSLLSLFPLAWLATIDLMATPEREQAESEPETFSPWPAALAGIFVALLYSLNAFLRSSAARTTNGGLDSFPILWSMASHLVVILAIFLCFECVRLLVMRLLPQIRATSFALNLVAFAVGAILLRKLVLATLGFNNEWANVYAIAMASVFVLAVRGALEQFPSESGPQPSARRQTRLSTILGILLVSAFSHLAPVLIGKNDWNFLLKKLSAVAVWAAASFLFYRLFGETRPTVLRRHTATLIVLGLACFAGYRTLAKPVSDVHADELDAYAGRDASFKLAREILTPALDDAAYQSFYEFLQRNTSLPESVQVQPVPIRIVEDLKPTTAPRPHIFYFIVDSLRQDYLSSYNKSVTFTPNFEAFGSEGIVFQNAFTRYGGTVLSIPAIWSGSMQLHKQYIEPFYPMAEMQRLIDTDGYTKWVTMDPVIKILLRPDPKIDELDRNASYWTEYDLNGTLKEVESRIDARGAREPLFVYSQAHNTHTATLSLLSKKRPPKKNYPGFNDLYASEVERIDAGFGEFIAFLKAHGLYDNSIVILTSDHGDSLGEFGRWGHGSTLFPEVVKIPLIVHVPTAMQKMYVDPQAVAFSMDLTPTLFYLLGHRPIRNDEMLGRPLFTETKAEHDAYLRDAYLLVSSYGPVYARLSEQGKSLFIVDAAAHENYLYDLGNDPSGIHNRLTLRDFPENERFIRQHVEDIARFYHYPAGLASSQSPK